MTLEPRNTGINKAIKELREICRDRVPEKQLNQWLHDWVIEFSSSRYTPVHLIDDTNDVPIYMEQLEILQIKLGRLIAQKCGSVMEICVDDEMRVDLDVVAIRAERNK